MAPALLEVIYLIGTVALLVIFFKKHSDKNLSLRKHVGWWVLFGFIHNFVSFTWLYTVYPLIWMPEGASQLFGIFLLQFILSFFSGLCFFVVGVVLFVKKTSPLLPLFVGISFAVAEMLRSLVISLLYYGDKTTVGLHFNAGTIGNTLAITPLVEFAYLGGTYALSFVLTYIVATLFFVERRRLLVFLVPLGSIFMLVHYLVPVDGPASPVTVGVVTTDTKTSTDEDLRMVIKATNKNILSLLLEATSSPDIIVFPEDTNFLASLTEDELKKVAEKLNFPLFVDGTTVVREEKVSNLSLFFDSKEEKVSYSGKQFLLPFNEYIPYFFEIIFLALIGDEYTAYKENHTYTPLFSGKTYAHNNVRVATLICSEILSFSTVGKVKRENPNIVLFQSRLNVFNNNPLFIMHLRSFSRVAAAQLRRPLLASKNYAPSFIINGRGKMVGTIPKGLAFKTVEVRDGVSVILKDR